MLSVLLLILKIILLTIAILLGIVLVLLLSILFLPFCYQFYGKYEDEGYIEGSIRWILFVIHFKTTYEHEELTYDLKSFGYTIYSNREEWQEKHNKKSWFRKKKEEKQRKSKDNLRKRKKHQEENNGAMRRTEMLEGIKDSVLEIPEKINNDTEIINNETEKIRKNGSILSKVAFILEKIRFILSKIWSVFSYLFYFPWKVKESIFLGIEKVAELWNKVKPIFNKIEMWKAFLKEKTTKEAVKHIFSHLKFLWKGIKPKKFYGELHFGFEEPDKTGMLLGAISTGYGFIQKYVKVVPYFEQKIWKGSFYGKGNIQVFHIVRTGFRVYKDKLLINKWMQIQRIKES